MQTVRFISDPHFGHENMARRRGFNSAEEHDEHFITQFNDVVRSQKDITYILGDITMAKQEHIENLKYLNGVKHVALGNHEKRGHAAWMLQYVTSVFGSFKYKDTLLTHVPIHPYELEYGKILYCIHGHVHENTLNDNRYWNVSAEVIDYRPKTYEELKQIYLV